MRHEDFEIGCHFFIDGKKWRCTDKGSRTIAAIIIDEKKSANWYNGPPYAVAEYVMDEYDQEGCEPSVDFASNVV